MLLKKLKYISFFLLNISAFSLDLEIKQCINNVNLKLKNSTNAKNKISLSSLLIKDGWTINKKNFGKNINLKYNLASCSKHMTGLAIAILENKNNLSIEDYILEYLPELDSAYKEIKIKHLLFHTSGIIDYLYVININKIYDKKEKIDYKFILNFLKNNKKSFNKNNIGKEFVYNNTGYVLLAKIVEIVSGGLFEDFINEDLFKRAKLKNITINKIENNKSFDLFPLFKPVKERSKVLKITGDQGVFLNIDEYEKYAKALFFNEEIASNKLKNKLFYSGKNDLGDIYFAKNKTGAFTTSGGGYSYGLRQSYMKKNNHDIVFHCGYLSGYSSCFIFEPEMNILSAVFGNFYFPSFDIAYEYINCFYRGENEDI